jgi:acetyl esterase/lipase
MIVVDVEANVPYGAAASGSGQELLCDVYHPPVDAPPFPALPDGLRVGVLVIHGGAWMMGEKEQLVMWARGLAKKGYVCVLNGYRLASSPKQRAQIAAAVEIGDAGAVGNEAWAAEEGKWPSMIHDCKACVRWMRANCSELGISPDHIAVTGNSAGGHLSLLVAGVDGELYPELEGESGTPGVSSAVQACGAVYPPTTTRAPPFTWAPGANEREQRSFTPFQYASEHFPPVRGLY